MTNSSNLLMKQQQQHIADKQANKFKTSVLCWKRRTPAIDQHTHTNWEA